MAAVYAAVSLKAGLSRCGQEGQRSYFQLVPLAKRTVQEAAVLTLQTPGQKTFAGGKVSFMFPKDWLGTGSLSSRLRRLRDKRT